MLLTKVLFWKETKSLAIPSSCGHAGSTWRPPKLLPETDWTRTSRQGRGEERPFKTFLLCKGAVEFKVCLDEAALYDTVYSCLQSKQREVSADYFF